MDKPKWYRDMQSAVGHLFDEHARQAEVETEVETQAQAGLLESEGGETDAEVNDYGSFGKRSIRSLGTQRKKAKTIRLVGIVWTVPYCLRMWKLSDKTPSGNNGLRQRAQYKPLQAAALSDYGADLSESTCGTKITAIVLLFLLSSI
ncbi:uncharacterized protein NECHADRAFT_88640 [Fusarium vanettenii 77-13-4]|uniref:Uncharacterized protein n=1 Tax=Fusarium vanettenii (strain ATCC MYA-4622 / CBS 123669 / FGSC 9596 / NRRL 45880 / 77-13-4) TaxID=660122 RepID=C7ZC23_FUSV7|nr:uncharacterized protein NECHADRAFT_88640 [Fusarium vanettenii 77-13-4]EEU38518.1 hypothetical protein NECHADRAFT_88640 [Fusarium vanettenii 77-13-4]